MPNPCNFETENTRNLDLSPKPLNLQGMENVGEKSEGKFISLFSQPFRKRSGRSSKFDSVKDVFLKRKSLPVIISNEKTSEKGNFMKRLMRKASFKSESCLETDNFIDIPEIQTLHKLQVNIESEEYDFFDSSNYFTKGKSPSINRYVIL